MTDVPSCRACMSEDGRLELGCGRGCGLRCCCARDVGEGRLEKGCCGTDWPLGSLLESDHVVAKGWIAGDPDECDRPALESV